MTFKISNSRVLITLNDIQFNMRLTFLHLRDMPHHCQNDVFNCGHISGSVDV